MKTKTFRNNWFQFTTGFNFPSIRISPASYFDDRAMIVLFLGWGKLFLHLPIKSGINDSEYPEYGFYFHRTSGRTSGKGMFDSFWWCWGRKKYCFRMPWGWEWVRTSNLKKDGTWEHETKGNKKKFWEEKWKSIIWNEQHPYVYKLQNGTIQKVTATIKVVEREWRWRLLQKFPFPKMVVKNIDIEFDDEIGERTGSWKGGVLGCGYDILPHETPLQTLRRMEKERKFT